MRLVLTDPTRGNHVLDIIVTTFNDMLVEADVTTPLHSVEGVKNDHRCVHAKFRMPRVPTYDLHEYSYYRETEEGTLAFGE